MTPPNLPNSSESGPPNPWHPPPRAPYFTLEPFPARPPREVKRYAEVPNTDLSPVRTPATPVIHKNLGHLSSRIGPNTRVSSGPDVRRHHRAPSRRDRSYLGNRVLDRD